MAIRRWTRRTVFESNALLGYALGYGRRGFRVLALHTPDEAGGCSCRRPGCDRQGKHPRTQHGLDDATVDAEAIRGLWATWPAANVGVRCGDGLVILDVDGDDGADSLHELERKHGELPETVRSLSGRGAHVWLRVSCRIPPSVGRLGTGLDVRGDGSYFIAPPSLHPSGRRYEFDCGDRARIADAPSWLVERMRAAAPANGAAAPLPDVLPQGQRRPALLSLAGSMRRRGASAQAILSALRAENDVRCQPPLSDQEVEAIALDVARRYEPAHAPSRTGWRKPGCWR